MANASMLPDLFSGIMKGLTVGGNQRRKRDVEDATRKREEEEADRKRREEERQARTKLYQDMNQDVRNAVTSKQPPESIYSYLKATYPADMVAEIFPESRRTLAPSPNETRGETPTPFTLPRGGTPASLLAYSEAANAPDVKPPPGDLDVIGAVNESVRNYGAGAGKPVWEAMRPGKPYPFAGLDTTMGENREKRYAAQNELSQEKFEFEKQKFEKQYGLLRDKYETQTFYRGLQEGRSNAQIAIALGKAYQGTGQDAPPVEIQGVWPDWMQPGQGGAAPTPAAPPRGSDLAGGPRASAGPGGGGLPSIGDLSPEGRAEVESWGKTPAGITIRPPSIPKKQPTTVQHVGGSGKGGVSTGDRDKLVRAIGTLQTRNSALRKDQAAVLVRKFGRTPITGTYKELDAEARRRYDEIGSEIAANSTLIRAYQSQLGAKQPAAQAALSSKDEREIGVMIAQYAAQKKSGKKIAPWVRAQLRNNGFKDDETVNRITADLMNKYFWGK